MRPALPAGGDQVVTIFNLSEEQSMSAASVFPLLCGEKWGKCGQPLLATGKQVFRREGIGEFLQASEVPAFQEGIRRLIEADVFFPKPICQPVVLVQTHPGGERKVRAHAHEHPPPPRIVDVEVVLDNPTLNHL